MPLWNYANVREFIPYLLRHKSINFESYLELIKLEKYFKNGFNYSLSKEM